MKTIATERSRTVALALAAPRALASRTLHSTALAVVVSVLSTIAMSAWAQAVPSASPASGPMMQRQMATERRGEGPMGRGPGGGMAHRMGGPGMGGPGAMMMFHGSPEHMSRMIDAMLDGIGASDAQRAQIKQIAASAAADMKAQREAGRAMRDRAMQLFTAPTIDAGAVEKTRQQSLAQHDQTSKRMTQAMLDAARVLTPEQRAKLGERMRDRMARMQDRTARMQKMDPDHPRPPR